VARRGVRERGTLAHVPGLYLGFILFSICGMVMLVYVTHRELDVPTRLREVIRPIAIAIVAVEIAFLAFDALGSARGWFASNPQWVIAIFPPGIPPEEPVLLGFLALLTLVMHAVAGVVLKRLGIGAWIGGRERGSDRAEEAPAERPCGFERDEQAGR
jgi:hypothetical protein